MKLYGLILAVFLIVSSCKHAPAQLETKPTAPKESSVTAVPPVLPAPITSKPVTDLRQLQSGISQVAASVNPSVVSIEVIKKVQRRPFYFGLQNFPQLEQEEEGKAGTGSGFIIDPRGFIVTNRHVIAGAHSLKVHLMNGKVFDATVVGTGGETVDLAVIKIDPKGHALTSVRFGNSDEVEVANFVMAIGNPLGFDHTVTFGIISAKEREVELTPQRQRTRFLQTDASINPGNSGGPLVNLNSEVIGVNTFIIGPGSNIGLGFAIPSNFAKQVCDQIIANGKASYSSIGISMMPIMAKKLGDRNQEPTQAVMVNGLLRGGPAAQANIQIGDLIVSIDSKLIANPVDVQSSILALSPGTSVKIGILRSNKRYEQIRQYGAQALTDVSGPFDDEKSLEISLKTVGSP